MNPRFRYGLIALGVLVFMVLTPFIIVFVTGIKYDFHNGHFVKTGAIRADSEPAAAQIFLNDKNYGKTPKTLRFLMPGNYKITFKKPGYFDWSKTLTVRGQYLTKASGENDKIFLLLRRGEKNLIAANADNFFAGAKKLLYQNGAEIILSPIDDTTQKKIYTLPQNPGKLTIIASTSERYFFVYNEDAAFIIDSEKNKALDLDKLVKQAAPFLPGTIFQASTQQFGFSDQDKLYQLLNGTVYSIDWAAGLKKPLADNSIAFAASNGYLYTVNVDFENSALVRRLVSRPLADLTQQKTIMKLPAFKNAALAISPRSQVFIIGDGSLYAASNNLEHISDYTMGIDFTTKGKVIFYSANEIGIYNPENFDQQIILRSDEPISAVSAAFDFDWILYIAENRLRAVETDTRSVQNNYPLGDFNAPKNFKAARDLKSAVVSDNNSLYQIKLR